MSRNESGRFTRRIGCVGALFIGGATAFLLVGQRPCIGADRPVGEGVVREIASRLQERQQRVRSAKFVSIETRVYLKGSIPDPE